MGKTLTIKDAAGVVTLLTASADAEDFNDENKVIFTEHTNSENGGEFGFEALLFRQGSALTSWRRAGIALDFTLNGFGTESVAILNFVRSLKNDISATGRLTHTISISTVGDDAGTETVAAYLTAWELGPLQSDGMRTLKISYESRSSSFL